MGRWLLYVKINFNKEGRYLLFASCYSWVQSGWLHMSQFPFDKLSFSSVGPQFGMLFLHKELCNKIGFEQKHLQEELSKSVFCPCE